MAFVGDIARRMATQFWGAVQRQRLLAEGIWWFTTACHGGLVVDVSVRTELAEFQSPVYYGHGQKWIIQDEQHFAAFEEDCNAAIVEWMYPEIMRTFYAWSGKTTSVPYELWVYNRFKKLENSLAQWNPEWLAKHPNPGM